MLLLLLFFLFWHACREFIDCQPANTLKHTLTAPPHKTNDLGNKLAFIRFSFSFQAQEEAVCGSETRR